MKAIAIILAAGESKRMGLPKALLSAGDGRTFLQRLAQTFSEAGFAPLAVVGAHADEIRAAHPRVATVVNPHWQEGQLSSVRVGLRAALAQGARRILIHPVDVPMIAVVTASRMHAELEHSPALIASSNGKPGHPLGLRADGAMTLLRSNARTLEEGAQLLGARQLAVADPLVLDNLNTPEAFLLRFGHNPRGV